MCSHLVHRTLLPLSISLDCKGWMLREPFEMNTILTSLSRTTYRFSRHTLTYPILWLTGLSQTYHIVIEQVKGKDTRHQPFILSARATFIGDELLHFGLENLSHCSFNKGKCVFVFCFIYLFLFFHQYYKLSSCGTFCSITLFWLLIWPKFSFTKIIFFLTWYL